MMENKLATIYNRELYTHIYYIYHGVERVANKIITPDARMEICRASSDIWYGISN